MRPWRLLLRASTSIPVHIGLLCHPLSPDCAQLGILGGQTSIIEDKAATAMLYHGPATAATLSGSTAAVLI